jgi:hypothetical protein
MKTYQSTIENIWIEVLPVTLTKEQRDLITSQKEEDRDAQKELSQLIKSQREGIVELVKSEQLSNLYDTLKPELKETDEYQLIGIDLSEKQEGKFTGILNFRINGEHKQIRL